MQGEQAQRVAVMSNADGQKQQIFMTGEVSNNETPRKHAAKTTEVILDWKLAEGVPAKAFVGNKETMVPEGLMKKFQVLPSLSSSAYELTKHVVANQIEFARYNLAQIKDAIAEVSRLIEAGKIRLKSQALGQLQEIQQNAAAVLTKVEEATSEVFPIASVMDFVGCVDDFIKNVLKSTSVKDARVDLQKLIGYPLAVAKNSAEQVRKTLVAAKDSARTILSTESIKSTIAQSVLNLQNKLNLLKQIFQEKVQKFRAARKDSIGNADEPDDEEDDKYSSIVLKIETVVEVLKSNVLANFTIEKADRFRTSLWDLFQSLENLRLKTRDMQDQKTVKLIRSAKEMAERALKLLKNRGKCLIELLKSKTKEQLSEFDLKLKEKATKVAAATQAKVKSLNSDYNISGKIYQSRTQADTFLKSWGIDVNGIVSKVLEKVNDYDEKLMGGKGKHLLQKARDTAENVQNAISSVSQTGTEE